MLNTSCKTSGTFNLEHVQRQKKNFRSIPSQVWWKGVRNKKMMELEETDEIQIACFRVIGNEVKDRD